MLRVQFVLWVGLVGLLSAVASGETIVLTEGQTIKGEVIREFPDRIIIDLGFDIVSIPRRAIPSST